MLQHFLRLRCSRSSATAIKAKLGILEEDEIREDFVGRSFLMESLIQLLVQAGRRDVLESWWREISYPDGQIYSCRIVRLVSLANKERDEHQRIPDCDPKLGRPDRTKRIRT